MQPGRESGLFKFDFDDVRVEVPEFDFKLNGEAEVSEAAELIVENFEDFFKEEMLNIIVRQLTKKSEDEINSKAKEKGALRNVGEDFSSVKGGRDDRGKQP